MTTTTALQNHLTGYPWAKHLLRTGYSVALRMHTFATAQRSDGPPRVWYGGARTGDRGGPLVKVKRLREFFPEVWVRYNLVYLLSNAPYLPASALGILKQRKVPTVYNQNGVFYKAWYAGDWIAENLRMARAYQIADWVFYQSEFCKRAADRFLGARSGQGEVLYNAVDTRRFTPRTDTGSGAPFVFLATGKLDDHLYYRIDCILGGLAMARRRGLDAQLIVAGKLSPSVRERADRQADGLGISKVVVFPGPYSQIEAPALYRSADAYLSTTHQDACPNAVLEALASGLPVIYAGTGGVPELVGTEAGVGLGCIENFEAVQVPSAETIAEAMAQVANSGGAMSLAARERAVQRFDMEAWIERHRTVFTQLLQDHGVVKT